MLNYTRLTVESGQAILAVSVVAAGGDAGEIVGGEGLGTACAGYADIHLTVKQLLLNNGYICISLGTVALATGYLFCNSPTPTRGGRFLVAGS